MATKEKWIDLFEKAVGRPPHALEIEEGQKADFDLKAIKGIATTHKMISFFIIS